MKTKTFSKLLFLLLFLPFLKNYSQDSTQSQAFKNNVPENRLSIGKLRSPNRPLISSYYLMEEAKKENPIAEHVLGLSYLLGEGFESDTAKAILWIEKAAKSNLPSACFNLGIIKTSGIGKSWNPFEAYILFQKAAEMGMPEAQFILGILHSYSLTVNKDLQTTYNWVKKSANQNYKPAIEMLKDLNEMGIIFTDQENIIPKLDSSDIFENSKYILNENQFVAQGYQLQFIDSAFDSVSSKNDKVKFEEYLKSDNSDLKKKLGFDYSISKNEFEEDKDTSTNFELIEKGVFNGSPEALMILGKAYELGVEKEQDSIKAMSNYIQAFRLGALKAGEILFSKVNKQSFFKKLEKEIKNHNNFDAMYVWAIMTTLGYDYQLSKEQVIQFLEKSASAQHVPSILELGTIYFSGTFVEKNEKKAFEFWQKAKDLGNIEGGIRIAFSRLNSENISKMEKSNELKFIRKVAENGSVFAQALMGLIFEKGIFVEQDKGKASEYYRLAASRGNETAYLSLKSLYDELRPKEEIFQIIEK